jgi:hypothetical protein
MRPGSTAEGVGYRASSAENSSNANSLGVHFWIDEDIDIRAGNL